MHGNGRKASPRGPGSAVRPAKPRRRERGLGRLPPVLEPLVRPVPLLAPAGPAPSAMQELAGVAAGPRLSASASSAASFATHIIRLSRVRRVDRFVRGAFDPVRANTAHPMR